MEDLRAEDPADALGWNGGGAGMTTTDSRAMVVSPPHRYRPGRGADDRDPGVVGPFFARLGGGGRPRCNSVVRRWVSEPVSRTSRVVRPPISASSRGAWTARAIGPGEPKGGAEDGRFPLPGQVRCESA